jgi:hypothetical protein
VANSFLDQEQRDDADRRDRTDHAKSMNVLLPLTMVSSGIKRKSLHEKDGSRMHLGRVVSLGCRFSRRD